MKKGFFIVFEGGEGSGKSTILEKIYQWLIDENSKVIKTREPGGIRIAEQIREIILSSENEMLDGKTEALLFAAARRQHLVEKVIPALAEGKVVLCDRFVDSSLAYQGYARGFGIEEIYNINLFAIDDCKPDLTILFDIEPSIGLDRIKKNSSREVNRLDKEKLEFHNKVREGYHEVLKINSKMVKVDASKSIEEVFEEVKEIISKHIG